jgi:hypothetical protein
VDCQKVSERLSHEQKGDGRKSRHEMKATGRCVSSPSALQNDGGAMQSETCSPAQDLTMDQGQISKCEIMKEAWERMSGRAAVAPLIARRCLP